MLCRQCGNVIDDNSRFCPYCGSDNRIVPETENEQSENGFITVSHDSENTPRQNKKKSKKKTAVIIISVLAAVLIIVGAALFAYFWLNRDVKSDKYIVSYSTEHSEVYISFQADEKNTYPVEGLDRNLYNSAEALDESRQYMIICAYGKYSDDVYGDLYFVDLSSPKEMKAVKLDNSACVLYGKNENGTLNIAFSGSFVYHQADGEVIEYNLASKKKKTLISDADYVLSDNAKSKILYVSGDTINIYDYTADSAKKIGAINTESENIRYVDYEKGFTVVCGEDSVRKITFDAKETTLAKNIDDPVFDYHNGFKANGFYYISKTTAELKCSDYFTDDMKKSDENYNPYQDMSISSLEGTSWNMKFVPYGEGNEATYTITFDSISGDDVKVSVNSDYVSDTYYGEIENGVIEFEEDFTDAFGETETVMSLIDKGTEKVISVSGKFTEKPDMAIDYDYIGIAPDGEYHLVGNYNSSASDRNDLRKELAKSKMKVANEALYYCDFNKSEKVSDFVKNIQDAENGVAVYQAVNMENCKILLSEMQNYNKDSFISMFNSRFADEENLEYRIAKGTSGVKIKNGLPNVNKFNVSTSGEVFFTAENDEGCSLYSVKTNSAEAVSVYEIDDDVSQFYMNYDDSALGYYISDSESESYGELYINGKETDDNVYQWKIECLPDNTIFYYTRFIEDSDSGTLHYFDGTKSVYIADNVHFFGSYDKEKILYISRGELICFDLKSRKAEHFLNKNAESFSVF